MDHFRQNESKKSKHFLVTQNGPGYNKNNKKGPSTFSIGFQPSIETFEFQREKKQAYSIFYGEFKSIAKKILVLGEDGQNRKKHPIAKEHAIFPRK